MYHSLAGKSECAATFRSGARRPGLLWWRASGCESERSGCLTGAGLEGEDALLDGARHDQLHNPHRPHLRDPQKEGYRISVESFSDHRLDSGGRFGLCCCLAFNADSAAALF